MQGDHDVCSAHVWAFYLTSAILAHWKGTRVEIFQQRLNITTVQQAQDQFISV